MVVGVAEVVPGDSVVEGLVAAEVEFDVGVATSVVAFTSSVVAGIIAVVIFTTGASVVVELLTGTSLLVGFAVALQNLCLELYLTLQILNQPL